MNQFLSTILTFSFIISPSQGFLDNWYMVPPLGTTLVLNLIENRTTVLTLIDQPAAVKYESQIPDVLEGYLIIANPPTACRKLDPPPGYNDADELSLRNRKTRTGPTSVPAIGSRLSENAGKRDNGVNGTLSGVGGPDSMRWILLAQKSECSYRHKVEYAHLAGYTAIIVANNNSNDTEVIGLTEDEQFDLLIPAYFVGEHDGRLLRDKYSYVRSQRHEYIIRIESQTSFYQKVVLYIVWSVLGLFLFVLFICLVKPCYSCLIEPWWREQYERRKRRVMFRAVTALPVIEWKTENLERYETCVICLETYIDKDLVRVLKCSHGFHMNCIDSWLLKVRRNCPICKSKLFYSRCWDEFSDSDISEGNYFTGGTPQEPRRARRNTMLQEFSDYDLDTDSFSRNIERTLLNTRTLNEISWSSTSTSSSSLTSDYSTAMSTNDGGAYPTTIVSRIATIHTTTVTIEVETEEGTSESQRLNEQ